MAFGNMPAPAGTSCFPPRPQLPRGPIRRPRRPPYYGRPTTPQPRAWPRPFNPFGQPRPPYRPPRLEPRAWPRPQGPRPTVPGPGEPPPRPMMYPAIPGPPGVPGIPARPMRPIDFLPQDPRIDYAPSAYEPMYEPPPMPPLRIAQPQTVQQPSYGANIGGTIPGALEAAGVLPRQALPTTVTTPSLSMTSGGGDWMPQSYQYTGLPMAQAELLQSIASNPPWAQPGPDISPFLLNPSDLLGSLGSAYGMQGGAGQVAPQTQAAQNAAIGQTNRMAADIAEQIANNYAARGMSGLAVPATAEAQAGLYGQLPGTLANIGLQGQQFRQQQVNDLIQSLLGVGQYGLGAGQLGLQAYQTPNAAMQWLPLLTTLSGLS